MNDWGTIMTGCVAGRRPYGWDTLVENLTDPSHLPFSHHTVLGNRCAVALITLLALEVPALFSQQQAVMTSHYCMTEHLHLTESDRVSIL